MNRIIIFQFLFYILQLRIHSIRADQQNNRRLQLKVYKHQPCNNPASANEKIRFASNDEAPLQADPERGDGCYAIRGTVKVFQPINGVIQVYVETKYGTRAPTEHCQGADQNGCGGVGSCVYCDACQGIKNLGKSSVKLVVGNKAIDCRKGLAAKDYTDMKMTFCMPSKAEFLKSQNISEDFWNHYGSSGQMVFISMYVFNKEINSLARSELMRQATADSEQVIGCHKLVGSVSEDQN